MGSVAGWLIAAIFIIIALPIVLVLAVVALALVLAVLLLPFALIALIVFLIVRGVTKAQLKKAEANEVQEN